MNRKKAHPFICKKLLDFKKVPAGWNLREGREYEWSLTADKGSLFFFVILTK